MRFDTVFFDLDGTLTDSASGILNSIEYAMEKMGMEKRPREELYTFIGPPLIEELQRLYGVTHAFAVETVEHFHVYFADRGIYENELYDGVPEMLARLHDSGQRLVLATSKPEFFARKILERFNLTKYFTEIGGSTMDETRTEKAEVISYVMAKLDVKDTSCCLMVGDRRHDILGAKKNAMSAMGVLYGYGSREELESAGASWIAESVPHVADLILSL